MRGCYRRTRMSWTKFGQCISNKIIYFVCERVSRLDLYTSNETLHWFGKETSNVLLDKFPWDFCFQRIYWNIWLNCHSKSLNFIFYSIDNSLFHLRMQMSLWVKLKKKYKLKFNNQFTIYNLLIILLIISWYHLIALVRIYTFPQIIMYRTCVAHYDALTGNRNIVRSRKEMMEAWWRGGKRFREERHVCYRVRNEGEKKRTR